MLHNLVSKVQLFFQQPQSQQDAAEFLMWLLDVLHRALNCSPMSSPNHNGSIVGKFDVGVPDDNIVF